MSQRMRTSPFTTVEVGTRPSVTYPGNRRGRRPKRRGGEKWRASRSLLVKVGICAAACLMMFVMKALDEAPAAAQMVSSVKGAVNDETDLTEMLGKLQFVELPSALEVFSPNAHMVLPVSAPNITVSGGAEYAEWSGAPNAEVIASAAGQVRAIGEDAMMGSYVRLQHQGDLETVYYGLADIRVEQGQPIRRQDTLGTLGEDGVLRLSVLLSGKPQPPGAYLDIG